MTRRIRFKKDFSSLEPYHISSKPDPLRSNTVNVDTDYVPVHYPAGAVVTVEVYDERFGTFLDVQAGIRFTAAPEDYIEYIS